MSANLRLTNYGEKAYHALTSPAAKRTARFYSQLETDLIKVMGSRGLIPEQAVPSLGIDVFRSLINKGLIWDAPPNGENPLLNASSVILDATPACNYNCRQCYRNVYDRKASSNDMAAEEFRAAINVLQRAGFGSYCFHGGEATLRQDLPEIIASASDKGRYHVALVTNGSRDQPDYLEKLVENGLNAIWVSIDGVGKEHDRLRQEGAFERAVKTVRNATEISRSKHLNVVVHATPDELIDAESLKSGIEKYVCGFNSGGRLFYNCNSYSLLQVGNAANVPTRSTAKPVTFDDLRPRSFDIDRIFVRYNGKIGYCWIGYGNDELGTLDRSSLGNLDTSLVNILNNIQQTDHYRYSKKIGELVQFVDEDLFPQSFETEMVPRAITISVWHHMNRLAKELNKEPTDPKIVKEANRFVAKIYGYLK